MSWSRALVGKLAENDSKVALGSDNSTFSADWGGMKHDGRVLSAASIRLNWHREGLQNHGSTYETQWRFGALFAGLLNSRVNAAWMVCFLATERTRDEVESVTTKYARMLMHR